MIQSINILETINDPDYHKEISDIEFDSRNITKDSLFIAIKGYETDGHLYIDQARENGAVVAVVEEFVDCDIPQLRVENTRVTLADISTRFFDYPSRELNTVGITATNGKTTTSFMTNAIYKEAEIPTGLIGTVETAYGDISNPNILTTPESRDLQSYLRDMLSHGITDMIMEVSSHGSELSRVRGIEYDIVTFNNLSREHIDQHGTFENYYNIKSTLITGAKEEAWVVLNYDETMIKDLKDQTKGRVLSYSIENMDCDFGISDLDLSTGYARFTFHINKHIEDLDLEESQFDINLGVAGFSGVMNSVVAIIISLIRGIDIPTIQKGLEKFSGVERRFQVIYDEDYTVVDDHYANQRNISVTMETIQKMDYNNLHMIYAIRGCRGPNLNEESAEESAKWLKKLGVDRITATSSIEVAAKKDTVLPEEKQAFENVMAENNIQIDHYDRLDDGLYSILEKVKPGDLILLAGCQGMDPGGRILLEKITENMEESKRDKILEVLEGRAF